MSDSRGTEPAAANGAADRSGDELHTLLDTIDYGILFLDADLNIRIANRTYRQMWRFPPDFHDHRPSLLEDMQYAYDQGRYDIGTDDWPGYLERRIAAIRSADDVPSELRLADGRILQHQVVALSNGGRMLTYFEITAPTRRAEELERIVAARTAELAQAATAAQQAENEARIFSQRFVAATESMADGLAIFGSDDRLAYFNSRYPEHLTESFRSVLGLGLTFKEMVAEATRRGPVYHPDMGPDFAGRRVDLHNAAHAEHEHRLADGRWLRLREHAMIDGGRVLLTSDVTSRKEAEARARHSEAMLRTLTDAAPVMLMLSDEVDDIIFANAPFLEFCGCKLSEIAGQAWQSRLHPDDRDATLARIREGFERRERHEVEYRYRRADGAYRLLRDVNVPRLDPDGRFGGFVSAMEDITEKRQIEAELAQQREVLYHNEKLTALGSLLAGVAHELNNPLALVLAQAALLCETPAHAAVVTRAAKIKAAAERCAKIVRTFLAMARRRPPQRVAVDLNDTVDAALEVLSYGLRADGIVVDRRLAVDLPLTSADTDQLHQVAMNLLLNAQQAMADNEGARRITVTTRYDERRGQVEFVLDDSGSGVPMALRHRVFEPFFTTKPAGHGTGVGLSLCLGIVEAHGGSMVIDDAPGGGARFIVRLPHVAPENDRPGTVARTGGAGHAILIVDDELDVADAYAEILRAAGYRCKTAENGRRALTMLAAGRFDLILSDMRMPELDGPGLYRELVRADPAARKRVLFLTGDTLSPSAQAFLTELGQPTLEKPFDAAQLRAAVAEALTTNAADPDGGRHIG